MLPLVASNMKRKRALREPVQVRVPRQDPPDHVHVGDADAYLQQIVAFFVVHQQKILVLKQTNKSVNPLPSDQLLVRGSPSVSA